MPKVAVVGATGAVGGVLLGILRERGFEDVRLYASSRSAGRELDGRPVEEATPEALATTDVDLFFFAVGAAASRELVPQAVRAGAVVLDKSSAWRMEPNVPLVVPEVNPERALEHEGILERHSYAERPPRVEYELTAKGEALLPCIDEMRRFGREWLRHESHAVPA